MKFNHNFSILFWLFRKKENKQGLVPIYARITIDGVRAECSIKRRIAPEYWDVDKGQASDAYLEASVLNEYLAMVRAEIGKHYNVLLSTQDHVTAQHVKNSYLGDRTKMKVKKTFLHVFRLYLQMLEEKVNASDLSTGRYKRFGVLYRKCESFIKYKFKVADILPEEMKLNFVVGFEHYLRTVQRIGHNTAMKYAKDLKQVMTYATIEEDITYNPFQIRSSPLLRWRASDPPPVHLRHSHLRSAYRRWASFLGGQDVICNKNCLREHWPTYKAPSRVHDL